MVVGWQGEFFVEYPYILLSSASCYKKSGLKIPTKEIKAKEIFLDSGGFTFFTRWEKYPYTPDEYVAFIENFCEKYPQTKYVAIMDYPCESFVNRKNLSTNKQRIHETIQNTKYLLKQKIPAQWVSVIQGHELYEYIYCMEQMFKERLFTPLTAIGSICTRKQCGQIFNIVNTVKKYNPEINIHAFGLELPALYDRNIWDILYSCDSGAWKFNHDSDWKRSGLKKGNWRPESLADKEKNFGIYLKKVNRLFENRNGNKTLIDFRWQNLCDDLN
jgi:hypothetical protein